VLHFENSADKAKGTSNSGLTSKSFHQEINNLGKGRPRKKTWKCLPLFFNKSIRNLLPKHLKKPGKTKIFWMSQATVWTK
jgi:hypothetical protein